MAKCGYPPCPVQIESGGDNPSPFCEKHLIVKCNCPTCEETIIPGADTCLAHNKMVREFDWIHGVRHMQAAQQVAEQEYKQRLLNGLKGGRP